MLQNATPLRNQRPNRLISLMNMSLVLRLPRKMHLCRSSSHVPRLPTLLKLLQNPHDLVTFDKVQSAESLAPARRNDIWTSKSAPKLVCFVHLTSKRASRHNNVHFFDIWTSKSAPSMVCFVHFHFEMCFAPQRRAPFGHRNFQKCSEREVFCTFWLRNVLRAMTACTFSTSQLPKVLRAWFVVHLTSKRASRHNSVQLFISHLARWLHIRRFSEPTFWASGVFAHLHPLSSHSFSSLILSLLLFSSLTLPTSAFPSAHIVGSLTSKLSSTNIY